MTKIYAKKGDIVTCTEGHTVLTFKCDVSFTAAMEPTKQLDFADDQIEPMLGTDLKDCLCHCGANYIRTTYDGYGIQLHFASEGWRTQ